MGPVWLHIGTPKSGTSSLQAHFARGGGAEAGFHYVTLPGKACVNDLAIAYNRGRDSLRPLAAMLDATIAAHPDETLLLSSEMLYGVPPAAIYDLLPALQARPLRLLVYLRRQDRYLEAKYLQKAKNGRFDGDFADYIERFDGSGADYWSVLAPWRDLASSVDVQITPRIFERDQLVGGDVVVDACAALGLALPEGGATSVKNTSPGLQRVQLLQLAAQMKLGNPRKLQRRLSATYPQTPEERGSLMTVAERRALVARFAQANAKLRAAYFPKQTQLFDTSDLAVDVEETGVPAFTEAQLEEIRRFLDVVVTDSNG